MSTKQKPKEETLVPLLAAAHLPFNAALINGPLMHDWLKTRATVSAFENKFPMTTALIAQ